MSASPQCRRPNPVYSAEYRAVATFLREAREAAGLSQRQLAKRIARAASHISLIERGQRRVDTLEAYVIARALGCAPAEFFSQIVAAIDGAMAAAPDGE